MHIAILEARYRHDVGHVVHIGFGNGDVGEKLEAIQSNLKHHTVFQGVGDMAGGRHWGSALSVGLRKEKVVMLAGGILAHTIFDKSEEHTSELQSLMRISYAVFC